MEGWDIRCSLHFKFIPDLQSVWQMVSCQCTQFNYYIMSGESAKNRPVFDDIIDNWKLYLYQAKVELLKVVVHEGQKSSVAKGYYVHPSSQGNLKTVKSVSSKLYG